MGLTDWKNWTDGEWYRKDDKYSYVKVWKTGLSSKEVKRRGIKPYIFEARIGREGETKKEYFDKRSQAMKYAKEFMENN